MQSAWAARAAEARERVARAAEERARARAEAQEAAARERAAREAACATACAEARAAEATLAEARDQRAALAPPARAASETARAARAAAAEADAAVWQFWGLRQGFGPSAHDLDAGARWADAPLAQYQAEALAARALVEAAGRAEREASAALESARAAEARAEPGA